MAIELPSLPFAQNALEPHISANTLSFHHGKHHNAYVTKTNQLIQGTDLANSSLDEIIAAAKKAGNQGLYNQSAQVWNHSFFWKTLRAGGGGQPSGEIGRKINDAFGGFDAFAEQFKASAVGNFGSGWTWLVSDGGALKIVNTQNAGTPVADGVTPLITIDVWEHAYYLDYQNRRPDFVQAFLDHLVNWEFAEANLAG